MKKVILLLFIVLHTILTEKGRYYIDPIEIRTNVRMPVVGYGTLEARGSEFEIALDKSLELGYRHIDTATLYQNEQIIGKVVKKWIASGKLKREDLFIVTKLPAAGNRPSSVKKFLSKSLKDLQLDYVDLYLIHVPFGMKEVGYLPVTFDKNGRVALDKTTDHIAIWKAMEAEVNAGRARAIGVSNFNITQMIRLQNNSVIKPANLQIEMHAYLQQKPLLDFCKKNGISVTGYATLGSSGLPPVIKEMYGVSVTFPNLLQHPVPVKIAEKHNVSSAQVLLRHIVEKGVVVIPKSINPERLKQNIGIFDFKLDDEDVVEMDALDLGDKGRLLDFNFFRGIFKHPEYPFSDRIE